MEKEKKANSLNNIIKILEQNKITKTHIKKLNELYTCLLYTSPSPRD